MQTDFLLKNYNTFQLEVKSNYFTSFCSTEDLITILKNKPSHEVLVLGEGSNVLFTKDFEGLILYNTIKGIEVQSKGENIYLEIGGGENWHDIVTYCVENNWGGIENLALIPGTMAAGPIQNIGAYGVELKDVFVSLDAVNIDSLEKRNFPKEMCRFGYRDSFFKTVEGKKWVITSVKIVLKTAEVYIPNIGYGNIEEILNTEKKNSSIKSVYEAVIAIRKSKLPDPKIDPNAGSFFKNPIIATGQLIELQENYPKIPNFKINDRESKVPAAWLIETIGYKGKRTGNVAIHDKQALVIITKGATTGKEILDFSEIIIREVMLTFGILLEREVNVY